MFIFLLLFLILILPFKIKIGLHINVLENKGFYLIKVLFIKMLCGRVRIKEGKLEFENNNDLIFKKSKDEVYLNKVFMCLLSEMEICDLQIFIEFGNKSDAAQTAIFCGALESVLSGLFAVLKTKFNYMYQFLDIDTNYNKDALEATVGTIISISLWQILKCLIKAKYELRNLEK